MPVISSRPLPASISTQVAISRTRSIMPVRRFGEGAAQRAEFEIFQHGEGADKVDQRIDEREVEKIGTAAQKSHDTDQQHRLGADSICRENTIIGGRAENGAQQRKRDADQNGDGRDGINHERADPSIIAVMRRSMSPARTPSAPPVVRAWMRSWSPSRSTVTVPGVRVMELA